MLQVNLMDIHEAKRILRDHLAHPTREVRPTDEAYSTLIVHIRELEAIKARTAALRDEYELRFEEGERTEDIKHVTEELTDILSEVKKPRLGDGRVNKDRRDRGQLNRT